MTHFLRDAVDHLANSRGRSTRHILIGLGITVGAVAISSVLARASTPTEPQIELYSDYEEAAPAPAPVKTSLFATIWPPLFLALTISGLRIWNAPRSAARTQALTLWGLVQGLNTVWMSMGPQRLGGQLAATVASLSASAAYAWRARRVDPPAAGLVTPYLGWIGLANVLSEELWRRKTPPAR